MARSDGDLAAKSGAARKKRGANASGNGKPAAPPKAPKSEHASIFPGASVPLDPDLVNRVRAAEAAFGMPAWLIVQGGTMTHPFTPIDEPVRDGFFAARSELAANGRVLLIVDSLGGFAREAYQIATMLRRHCGGYVAIVPRTAKSAATLVTLGADDLYMGPDSEIGPLDVQVFDFEEEERSSALDEVQALERLNAVALDQLDQTMSMLTIRTQKKFSTLLPIALEFTANMMRPLLEQVETVHYAKQSRLLKVAEEYANRLLEPKYGPRAEMIARQLVNDYTEHGFVINREEADDLLDLAVPTDDQEACVVALEEYLTMNDRNVIGRLKEG